ncbi:MAG: Zn-dependent protease with chaperone function [Kiritimatiellia bacterium]|jgi:Zn-dependent protease with chaperone function
MERLFGFWLGRRCAYRDPAPWGLRTGYAPRVTNSPLSRIRYAPERTLIELLFERYGLEDVLRRYLERQTSAPWYELVTSSQVRLTPLIAPRLTGLLAEVKAELGFDEPIDLFVEPSAEINGFALHAIQERPHIVSVTSGLVERMTDVEIRFVLGHEVGHLCYRHYRSRLLPLAMGADEEGDSRIPALLQRRLESWDRLAELSADRSGHAAVRGDLEAIVSTFFKMASGLGPEHLRYDIDAFLAQLLDLEQMERRDLLARFSHPTTPVRVRSIQLFGLAGGFGASEADLRATDVEVARVAAVMEMEATEPLQIHLRDVLVGAGLIVLHADGRPPTSDQALLLQLALLPLCSDPESTVGAVQSHEQARELMSEAATWLGEHAGEERIVVFTQLGHMATMDGDLDEGEESFLLDHAAKLNIPKKQAKSRLYDAAASYLQTQASTKTPSFALSPGDKPDIPGVD